MNVTYDLTPSDLHWTDAQFRFQTIVLRIFLKETNAR
jgi:hypothetical protein